MRGAVRSRTQAQFPSVYILLSQTSVSAKCSKARLHAGQCQSSLSQSFKRRIYFSNEAPTGLGLSILAISCHRLSEHGERLYIPLPSLVLREESWEGEQGTADEVARGVERLCISRQGSISGVGPLGTAYPAII